MKMGAAVTSDLAKELAEQSTRILESDTQRKKMEDALQNYKYLGGAETILKELDNEQEKAGQQFFLYTGSNETYEKEQYGRLQGVQAL